MVYFQPILVFSAVIKRAKQRFCLALIELLNYNLITKISKYSSKIADKIIEEAKNTPINPLKLNNLSSESEYSNSVQMEPRELPIEAKDYVRFDITNQVDIKNHLEEYGFVIIANAADASQVFCFL